MEKTVGEIAAENPSSVRVFEKYNIDYCCSGKLPLSTACQARGINTADLEKELAGAMAAQPANGRDWNRASLDLLIDHILSTHHVYLKGELPRLGLLLDKVLAAHGPKHGASLRPLSGAFAGLREELETHMMKEEMVLFPMIRNLEAVRQEGGDAPAVHCGSVSNPIRVMKHEHDSAGRALETMRRTTGDYSLPADACPTYRALFRGLQEMEADLHRHIHLENNILFPRAESL